MSENSDSTSESPNNNTLIFLEKLHFVAIQQVRDVLEEIHLVLVLFSSVLLAADLYIALIVLLVLHVASFRLVDQVFQRVCLENLRIQLGHFRLLSFCAY